MVISILAGGLGNQLFQYSFGFRLACQLQTPLRLERHLLDSRLLARVRQYTARQYELDVFGIEQREASLADTLGGLGKALIPGFSAIFLRENAQTSLDVITPNISDVVCLGYWQSDSYFQPVSAALRNQLIFRKPVSEQTRRIADSIRAHSNATFVHIRRGDYVSNATANQHHGVCDVSYYRQAVKSLRDQVANAHLFVFSDDQAWVRQELANVLGSATFIDHNKTTDSWQDMYLMSLCRHGIVANSSFSWWGAWLNGETNRIVIAPKQWFANQPIANERITPTYWHRL
ncbi:alpha-1,2-fucosyltransferase [Spirosoma terrae]|uniref:Alpha-1,2-fucosyltransferase n=1 Tax=Spirosoma terrae TaxID=1968276 RepID=A0A6L9L5U5_9BACT|nr:alpha-1,2-fucosyltransferase [Spirosoma terrae]NDU93698.1 alpha-1,2-fucosyltransferase [Spirosoma terrae]